jgi:hypothetical protein
MYLTPLTAAKRTECRGQEQGKMSRQNYQSASVI